MQFQTICISAVSLALAVSNAEAQHEHGGGHGDEHGKPVEFVMPKDFKGAVREIDHRMHEISELIEAKKVQQVHPQAEVIQKIGKVLGQLALKPDSGVPKDAVKDVNLAAKDLAAKFDAIDKAGDSGDLAGTQKVYGEMKMIADSLRKHAQLGEHGGVMLGTSDRKQFVEATLSRQAEVRLYFYDENLKALSVGALKVEATVGPRGAKETDRKPLALSPDAKQAFLSGRTDAALTPPLSLNVTVTAGTGKPEILNFVLEVPTAESDGHGGHEEGMPGKDKTGGHKDHKP